MPIAGDVKDWQEAVTGKDLITGEKLGWGQRAITAVAGIVPVLPGKGLRELVGLGGDLRKSDEIAEVFEESTQSPVARTVDELGDDLGVMKETDPSRAGMTPCGSEAPLHHLCTNKNSISAAQGGPWTQRFEALFRKAGMDLEDPLNKINVPGHVGPHPEGYHRAVFDRLIESTSGLSGSAYREALEDELRRIAGEVATEGTLLNILVTKQ